jgi:hypothetical protein
MGELNPDNIDRALMQEYEHCHNECNLEQAVKVTENLQPRRKVPEHSLRHQALLVNNCASTHKH